MIYRFFESLIDPLQPVPVQRPPVGVSAFFRHFLAPHRGLIAFALGLSGVAAITELLLYYFLGRLLDWMSQARTDTFLDQYMGWLILMLLIAAIIRPIAVLAARATINLALAPGLANATRWQNHRYVLRQSLEFFQNDFSGRIAQKVLQTGNALRECVVNVIDGVWTLVIYLLGIMLLFGGSHPLLLVPLLLWMVAYVLVIVMMVPPVRDKSAALSEATSVLSGRIVDGYTNIQAVKLFADAELEENFVAGGIKRHTRAFRTLMRSILGMTIALTVLNTVLLVASVAISIALWRNGAATIGEIATANGLIIRLGQMSGWILRTITSLFENVGTVQNGIETISQPLAVADHVDAGALEIPRGEVAFRHVCFNYRLAGAAARARAPDHPTVIDGCSFIVKPGERIGLVGRSGAGKSTLVNLLLRFHDIESGVIEIDGQDISRVSQSSLRQQIAVVTQDTSLLHRSIRDNIRYGNATASDAEVVAAARAASADFIDELYDPAGRRGLDAFVGERGVKLSGGQRQRIAIARVILKNAPILLLDEATSALDSEVEAEIATQLVQLMRGKTVIAIAHRLSTIAALDRLLVVESGRISEAGTHEELLQANGLYAQLWKRQSGGFLADG